MDNKNGNNEILSNFTYLHKNRHGFPRNASNDISYVVCVWSFQLSNLFVAKKFSGILTPLHREANIRMSRSYKTYNQGEL